MDASEILKRVEALHCMIYPGGGNEITVIVPAGEFPDDLSSAIREHKREILAILRVRYPAPPAVDAAIVARVEGIAVFWCDALQDMIACIRDESFLSQVPPGAVPYTCDELLRAFHTGQIYPIVLKMRHAVQKSQMAWRKRGQGER